MPPAKKKKVTTGKTGRRASTRKSIRASSVSGKVSKKRVLGEPDEIVHFPTEFGRIAIRLSTGVAIVLGIFALATLSSLVVTLRGEVNELSRMLAAKDVDARIYQQELQKARDQLLEQREGDSVDEVSKAMIRVIDPKTGEVSEFPFSHAETDSYFQGDIAGGYLYVSAKDGLYRMDLSNGVEEKILERSDIYQVRVSKTGDFAAFISQKVSFDTDQSLAILNLKTKEIQEVGPLITNSPEGVVLIGFSQDETSVFWHDAGGHLGHLFGSFHKTQIKSGKSEVVIDFDVKFEDPEGIRRLPLLKAVQHNTVIFYEYRVFGSVDEESGNKVSKEDPMSVILVDLETGKEKTVYRFPDAKKEKGTYRFSWSIDGSEIVYLEDGMLYGVPVKGLGFRSTIAQVPLQMNDIGSFLGVLYSPDNFVVMFDELNDRMTTVDLESGSFTASEVPGMSYLRWSEEAGIVTMITSSN